MIWQKQAKKLIDVLGLKGHPISVTYSIDPAKGTTRPKYWVCEALQTVREGKEVLLTEQSCVCRSGAWHVGLCPPPVGDEYKALAKFLVEGEKLCNSITAFYRMSKLTTPPPYGLGDCIFMSPLGSARLKPDIIIFTVNAEQASRLLTLATYETGLPPRIEMYGPTCHQVIGYPILSGEINISVMDITSRKRYKPDEMFFTLPGHFLTSVVESIEKSTAGIAPFEVPKDFAKRAFLVSEEVKPAKSPKKTRKSVKIKD